MNCFPCKGPACNSCGKFDRINGLVAKNNDIRCSSCGGRVDLAHGVCLSCGASVIARPGHPASDKSGGSYHVK